MCCKLFPDWLDIFLHSTAPGSFPSKIWNSTGENGDNRYWPQNIKGTSQRDKIAVCPISGPTGQEVVFVMVNIQSLWTNYELM